MSFTRISILAIEALCNQLAFTAPNATPDKGRYNLDEPHILRLATAIFKKQVVIFWICTFFEILLAINSLGVSLPFSSSIICPIPNTETRATPLLYIGALAVVIGTGIRIDCFRTMGTLFVFDLTVQPAHHLVTNRCYAHVRHPSYMGSMLIVIGSAFSHFTPGSWLTECGPLRAPASAAVVWAAWWSYAVAVARSRAEAEDRAMRKLFGREWEAYAAAVPWWFVPGLV